MNLSKLFWDIAVILVAIIGGGIAVDHGVSIFIAAPAMAIAIMIGWGEHRESNIRR